MPRNEADHQIVYDEITPEYPLVGISRGEMVGRLKGHGWSVETKKNLDNPMPFLVITGPFSGRCTIPVPLYHLDDHGPALDDVYTTLGIVMSEYMDVWGKC